MNFEMRFQEIFFIQFSIDWKSIKLDDDGGEFEAHNRFVCDFIVAGGSQVLKIGLAVFGD